MTIKDCDQLGAYLFEAGRQWGCNLDPKVARCLMEDIDSSRLDNFERKLEWALDFEEVFDENQRHAYKSALGHVYAERRQAKQKALKIPFVPR